MDKKNTILGLLFIGGAFFLIFNQTKDAEKRALEWDEQQKTEQAQEVATEDVADAADTSAADTNAAASPFTAETAPAEADDATTKQAPGMFAPIKDEPATVKAVEPQAVEELVTLENDVIRVTFTTLGGAIKHVEFVARNAEDKLKYPAKIDGDIPYVFNAGGVLPALAISLDADADGEPEEFAPSYKLLHSTDTKIYFEYVTANGIRITRGYEIRASDSEDEPYLILHSIAFLNETDTPFRASQLYVNVGTAPPTKSDVWGEYLNFGYYNGDDAEFIKMKQLAGSKGFLGIGSNPQRDYINDNQVGDVVWGAIKNQFFAGVLTPRTPGVGIYATDVSLGAAIDDPELENGMTGAIRFDLGRLEKGEKQELGMEYYVGPKEFLRLKELGDRQDLVMQFGFFGAISKILLYLMIGIHNVIGGIAPVWGWGFTIIIVTIIIKTLLFPLTQVQVRSAKRMQKIQPLMKELREKYKDDPQTMQAKTMALFKEHKVNPAAGCLPLILQIPIFFALFFMLKTASELRFAPFLWVPDLSLPDTVGHVMGFPINPLPLLMAISMFFQMQMMPAPSTDNMQRTLFKIMPFGMLFFTYNFPAGLVLYWTCQNLYTICQQWLTNRRKTDDDEEELVLVDDGKPVNGGGANKKSKSGKPSFSERIQAAKEQQLAAKRSLSGKGLPQQKKKKKK